MKDARYEMRDARKALVFLTGPGSLFSDTLKEYQDLLVSRISNLVSVEDCCAIFY